MNYRVRELYSLEQLSSQDSPVHRLHPAAKIFAAVFFIVTVVSFGKYSFVNLIPFIFYPVLMTALSGTPFAMLFKRFLIALPFCVFAGASNIFFDASIIYGVVSFITILVKAFLCVMSALLLVAVTPFAEITKTLRGFGAPNIFTVVFEMTYRYIGVLFDEAYSMYTAYTLRGVKSKGIAFKDMGGFVGQLLLRSFDRADRVYNAMKCRGYALRALPGKTDKLTSRDFIFCAAVCLPCVFFRLINFTGSF